MGSVYDCLLTQEVRSILDARKIVLSVVVFWGRGRYVRTLWPYIERNLKANMGIVGEVLLITHKRDHGEGQDESRAILESGTIAGPFLAYVAPFVA